MEFWLKTDPQSARWGFPTFAMPAVEMPETLLGHIENHWNLRVRPLASGPVATLRRSRNEEPGILRAHAFQYVGPVTTRPPANDFRSRWCLLEEAQRRIRRKPLQRIVHDVHRDFNDDLPLFDGV
ncbi:hypothetical protein AB1L30_14620 [Bremerella sp. JC817]|uniref:hypothetical protein n=1 Tax=Bremerella sp. JC817 TaxID=3231756 RepID=UPI003459E36A